MDLYQAGVPGRAKKAWIIGCELVLLALSYPILFGTSGAALANWMGWQPADRLPRRVLIFCFSIIVFVRTSYMLLALLRRQIPLEEAVSIPLAFGVYYIGFPLLTLRARHPVGGLTVVGVTLFVIGSFLNTASETQRARWKAVLSNHGHLYRAGLFAWSRHINYFGDVLWVTGYALVSRNPWSALIPIGLFSFFALYNVPKLEEHLRQHYGAEFDQYARSTARLIPFIY